MGTSDGDCESQQAHAETTHLWTRHIMMTTYYPHKHRAHSPPPPSPKLAHILPAPARIKTWACAPACILYYIILYGTLERSTAPSLMVALDAQRNSWQCAAEWKKLSCPFMMSLSLPFCHLIPSYSWLHTFDRLTVPQTSVSPSSDYKHPTNLEHDTHHLPADVHSVPFHFKSPIGLRSMSESTYSDL